MIEREVSFAPETAPLRTDETLLLIEPYFLKVISAVAGGEAVYNKFIAPTTDFRPLGIEGRMNEAQANALSAAIVMAEGDSSARKVYSDQVSEVYQEYRSTLESLSEIVGADNITLVTHEQRSPNDLSGLDIGALTPEIELDNPTFSFRFSMPNVYTAYPRDMATNLNGHVFYNTRTLRNLGDGEDFSRSPLGENGAILTAGKAVLMSEYLREKGPTAQKSKDGLKALGYKVTWFPRCDPERQPKGKRAIVEGHIDDHAALIEGMDGNNHLLVGSSFLHQDKSTTEKIRRASDWIDANLIEVDDPDLPHLAFNFIQLCDGSIMISSTGKMVDDLYYPSNLEEVLQGIVGVDRVRVLPALKHIPVRMQAGLRCMTNVLPIQFLQKAREATGQI